MVQHEGAASPVKRRPGSARPLMYRAAIQARHNTILLLWNTSALGRCRECGHPIQRRRTLKEIALVVGLRYGCTAGRHIDGKCKCLTGTERVF